MKTDSLFYTIFQELPFVFFALLGIPESATTNYQFTLLQLIIEPENTASDLATQIARQARLEIPDLAIRKNIINLLETIIVYKLPQKSREEIAAMLTLSDLKKTRFYLSLK